MVPRRSTRCAEDGGASSRPDHRANGLSEAGDPARWTVPQMADDVEELIRQLDLDRAGRHGLELRLVRGAEPHGAARQRACAYVLMGTVAGPAALHKVFDRLAAFEPEHLRDQVTASWEREATVQTAEECKQLLADQLPFHVADPEGPLVQWLIENDRVVYRPEVLRHFAAGGEYGMTDLRGDAAVVLEARCSS